MSLADLITADFTAILEEIGEDFVFADGSPEGKTVRGLFAGPGDRAELLGQGIQTSAPRLTVLSSAVAGMSLRDMEITGAGGSWRVAQPPRPDGRGKTVLTLEEI